MFMIHAPPEREEYAKKFKSPDNLLDANGEVIKERWPMMNADGTIKNRRNLKNFPGVPEVVSCLRPASLPY